MEIAWYIKINPKNMYAQKKTNPKETLIFLCRMPNKNRRNIENHRSRLAILSTAEMVDPTKAALRDNNSIRM
jgi:hypothetical protein